MKDCREEWFESGLKASVTLADVTSAAQALVNAHLCGPTSGYYLTRALAAVALLGAETSEKDECVSLQMQCTGPLSGLNVECTAEGFLRGYTKKKVLDDFDGMGVPKDAAVLGKRQLQVSRTIPGRILSQGISTSLDGYLAGSLQRRAVIRLEATVSDEGKVLVARGLMVEALPDCDIGTVPIIGQLMDGKYPLSLSVSSRTLLGKLGLEKAELKKSTPLAFGCRCSVQRAKDMADAIDEQVGVKRAGKIGVTCHMCGRTYEV